MAQWATWVFVDKPMKTQPQIATDDVGCDAGVVATSNIVVVVLADRAMRSDGVVVMAGKGLGLNWEDHSTTPVSATGHPPLMEGTDMDVDAELMQKFSCMGTTDKDVLISEFQRLLGFQLNPAGCAFFLDMTNWWVRGLEGLLLASRTLT